MALLMSGECSCCEIAKQDHQCLSLRYIRCSSSRKQNRVNLCLRFHVVSSSIMSVGGSRTNCVSQISSLNCSRMQHTGSRLYSSGIRTESSSMTTDSGCFRYLPGSLSDASKRRTYSPLLRVSRRGLGLAFVTAFTRFRVAGA